MGFFNKLMFWKKEDDEFDFDELAKKEMTSDSTFTDDLNLSDSKLPGLDEKSPFDQPMTTPISTGLPPHSEEPTQIPGRPTIGGSTPEGPGNKKELELVNSKLDTIKALLSSLDQRIANIERSTGVEQKEKRLW